MASPSNPWTLGPTALASLIERLGADGPREYEVIRRKLIVFMSWRGAAQPEAAADETLDRVARKLEDGVAVESIRGYVFGVARRVLLEGDRQERRDRVAQETWALLRSGSDDGGERERRLGCLDVCLTALSAENRAIVEAYHYQGERARASRVAMAARLGLSDGALRIRAYRIRNQLAACLRRCLAREDRNE